MKRKNLLFLLLLGFIAPWAANAQDRTIVEIGTEPTNLKADEVANYYAVLSWTSDANAWQICLNGDEENLIDVTENPFTLTGLTAVTPYTVKVRANCDAEDGVSAWTDVLNFTTKACPAPIAQMNYIGHNFALVEWTGNYDNYFLDYREAPGLDEPIFTEGFENGIGEWTLLNCDASTGISNTSTDVHSGNAAFCFVNNTNPPQYLISPEFTDIGEGMLLQFYYKNTDTSCPETFQIGFSTSNNEIGSFEFGEEYTASDAQWHLYTELIPDETTYICWKLNSNNNLRLCIDDILIATELYPEWITINNASSPQLLKELTPNTNYEVKVKGFCGNSFSDVCSLTFTTNKAYYWNDENTWPESDIPEDGANVTISESVIIPSGYTVDVNTIAFEGNGSLLIEDGGQLKTNSDVEATVLKYVISWNVDFGAEGGTVIIVEGDTLKSEEDNNRFMLITNPLNTQDGNPADYGMITHPAESYDLYAWDYTEELEWRNYKEQTFPIANGTGYLYANSHSMYLIFPGTVRANNEPEEVQLDNAAGTYIFKGWNLIGNPFMCEVYVNSSYYRMNEAGDEIEICGAYNAIAPMTGFFVRATDEVSSVTLSRENIYDKHGQLNMKLSSGRSTMDKAIITFGGSNLGKIQFNPNHSKIYMTQNGKDYAMLNADNQGEVPVSFKAEKDGTYTLSFTAEEVNFGYLHLIDNKTGADVDLLKTPSYTFDAHTTDYASRFRLVFVNDSNSNEDNFAFFSNGNLVINNEGNATLQVIDVMGRIMSSETINGCASINVNAATGVYMLRLINGDSVKVQKVIIK